MAMAIMLDLSKIFKNLKLVLHKKQIRIDAHFTILITILCDYKQSLDSIW